MPEPRVLIPTEIAPHKARLLDVSFAEFGAAHYLLPRGVPPSFRPDEAWRALRHALRDMDPMTDSIVWRGGDPLAMLMLGYLLRERETHAFHWLALHRPLHGAPRTYERKLIKAA